MFTASPSRNETNCDRKSRRGAAASALAAAKIGLGLTLALFTASSALAQTSVLTQHYDISRDGQNTSETILTPSNVNTASFGKLFSIPVDGYVYAEPLYVPNVTISGKGPHNVVFIATEHDSVYAFDADGNTGANATPLWQITLLDAAHGAASGATTEPNTDLSTGDIVPEIGITGTPVIDPTTGTIYLVGQTKEGGNPIQRLHALDITTGLEKFGGPVTLQASVAGTGNGSSGGTLNWDPKWENNRAGLLLLNGIVYIGFGSHGDNGPWHGWILAYNAATLAQTGAFCSTSNGAGSGIWMAGSGLAADVTNPTGQPYGRMFVATGNGSYNATTPYTNSMNYGDDHIHLDLTNGVPTVADAFTPYNQAALDNADEDVASGGILILPDQTAGGYTHLLVQAGKQGSIYLVNRDSMGGYSTTTDNIVQEITGQIDGLWSMPAYWNNNLYFWGSGDNLKAFSFTNGRLSATPTSKSAESSNFPGSTPVVSANGTTNGIVWNIQSDAYTTPGPSIFQAHLATNVSTLLYSTNQNLSRDNPGNAVKFTVPTVVNGKVYVGAEYQISVYGLLNGEVPAAVPVLTPSTATFNPSVQVSMSDSTSGATIYYTTDGSAPTPASTKYTAPITLTTTTTINAIALASGYLESSTATGTYTLVSQATMPTFTPAPGEYASPTPVTISTTTANATIYYTLNGTTPTTSSTKYTGPVTIGSTSTLQAIATASGLSNSPVSSGSYIIDEGASNSINFGSGFSAGSVILDGNATINGTRLRLTDGGANEAGAGWYPTPISIQTFTTDFSFQLAPGTNPTADGFTFTIQGNSTSVVGPGGGGLGYGPDAAGGTGGIANSVAVKFDLYSNAGEGTDSTGIYTDGASPTTPYVDMTSSGVNLHSGDIFNVHMTYDGTTLTMTITDATTNATFTQAWPINIPSTVGGTTAYVGFTGGTGGDTAIQDILTWTLVANGTQAAAAPTFSPVAGTYTSSQSVTISDTTPGAVIYYTTNGTAPTTSSSVFSASTPIAVSATETLEAMATASGYTQSPTTTALYTITPPAATPAFSPAPATYTSAQSVTITDTSAGVTIYYTTDNSTPTTSSTKYTAAIPVSSTTTIKAIASGGNFSSSAVATGLYTINSTTSKVITYVQSAYAVPQTAQSSVSVIYASAQTAGDLNVVAVGWSDATNTVKSVTDSKGNAYVLAVGPTALSGFGTQSIYYAKNIAAAAAGANAVTVTFSTAVAYPDIRIVEYTGADPGTPLDIAVGATGATATSSSGAATTANASDLIFGANYVRTRTTGPGAGFTSRVNTSPDGDIIEDEWVTATGSYTATAPVSPAGSWIMQMVAFRAAAGSTDTTPPTAPTNLTATAASSSQINLSWTASTDNVGVTGYRVERCQGSGCTTFAQIASPTATTYSDTGLSASTAYVYRVRATDAAGNLSTYSNTATATTQAGGTTTTITYVQGAYLTPQTSQTSVSVTFAAAQASGDLNVVIVGWFNTTSTISSVTDTKGNVYSLAAAATTASGVGTQAIYYAKNITSAAAAANAVTVTFNAAAPYPDVRILEFNGADLSTPLDVSASATGSSTTASSGSATTTHANDLLVGASYVLTGTKGAGTGYATLLLTVPDGDIAEAELVSATGSYSATAPISPTGAWIMQMAAFKVANTN